MFRKLISKILSVFDGPKLPRRTKRMDTLSPEDQGHVESYNSRGGL